MTSRTGVGLAEPAEQAEEPSKIRIWSQSAWPAGAAGRRRRPSAELRDESRELGKAGSGRGRDRSAVDVAGQGAQGLDDRTERQAVVAEGHRAALEDEPVALAEAVGDLGDEAALADARLAADEERGPGWPDAAASAAARSV